ncbi:C3HC zinc finger-like-domain-containing protein [Dipodascopsis tothii]|uniref:C3HC zinc finger-like-domain-containing protein n=1 Tax=Dipodascopsis tothii TaxID=44089 RepID=UPI0034CD34DC
MDRLDRSSPTPIGSAHARTRLKRKSLEAAESPLKAAHAAGPFSALLAQSPRARLRLLRMRRGGPLNRAASATPPTEATAAATPTATDQASTATAATRGPRFSPFSRPDLLSRLRTFDDAGLGWGAAEAVPVVDFARRGWIARADGATASCSLCGASVAVRPTSQTLASGSAADDARRQIIYGHADRCLWRKRGCDVGLYSLPLALDSDRAVAEFGERVQALRAAGIRSAATLPDDGQDALSRALGEPADAAQTLALCGLAPAAGSADTVVCSQCFASSAAAAASVEALHRAHCPWTSRTYNRTYAGWQVLLAVLAGGVDVDGALARVGTGVADTSAESVEDRDADAARQRPS